VRACAVRVWVWRTRPRVCAYARLSVSVYLSVSLSACVCVHGCTSARVIVSIGLRALLAAAVLLDLVRVAAAVADLDPGWQTSTTTPVCHGPRHRVGVKGILRCTLPPRPRLPLRRLLLVRCQNEVIGRAPPLWRRQRILAPHPHQCVSPKAHACTRVPTQPYGAQARLVFSSHTQTRHTHTRTHTRWPLVPRMHQAQTRHAPLSENIGATHTLTYIHTYTQTHTYIDTHIQHIQRTYATRTLVPRRRY
jgi:hypothetical protein